MQNSTLWFQSSLTISSSAKASWKLAKNSNEKEQEEKMWKESRKKCKLIFKENLNIFEESTMSLTQLKQNYFAFPNEQMDTSISIETSMIRKFNKFQMLWKYWD